MNDEPNQPTPPPVSAPPVTAPPEAQGNWTQPPQGYVHHPGYPQQPQNNPFDRIVPTRNPPALTAYYLGVFSLAPCLGMLLSPFAIGFGIKGHIRVKEQPELPGMGHAWAGIILGTLTLVANLIGIYYLVVDVGQARNSLPPGP